MGMIDPINKSNEACNKIRKLNLNSAWKVILEFNLPQCEELSHTKSKVVQPSNSSAKIMKSASED